MSLQDRLEVHNLRKKTMKDKPVIKDTSFVGLIVGLIVVILVVFMCLQAFAEESIDLEEYKFYEVKIKKTATKDDLMWFFNEMMHVTVSGDAVEEVKKRKSFELKEM